MTRIIVAILLALLLPTAARAQQPRETFKAANGRTLGWSTSNGSGVTTYYDAAGRNTGRSSTSGNTTTIYDAEQVLFDRRKRMLTTKNFAKYVSNFWYPR